MVTLSLAYSMTSIDELIDLYARKIRNFRKRNSNSKWLSAPKYKSCVVFVYFDSVVIVLLTGNQE